MRFDPLRHRIKDYLSSLPADRTVLTFTWTARYTRPWAPNEPQGCGGTVIARTWMEAACLVAEVYLKAATFDEFTDVLLRLDDKVILAWSLSSSVESIFDNEQIVAQDGPEILKFVGK